MPVSEWIIWGPDEFPSVHFSSLCLQKDTQLANLFGLCAVLCKVTVAICTSFWRDLFFPARIDTKQPIDHEFRFATEMINVVPFSPLQHRSCWLVVCSRGLVCRWTWSPYGDWWSALKCQTSAWPHCGLDEVSFPSFSESTCLSLEDAVNILSKLCTKMCTRKLERVGNWAHDVRNCALFVPKLVTRGGDKNWKQCVRQRAHLLPR